MICFFFVFVSMFKTLQLIRCFISPWQLFDSKFDLHLWGKRNRWSNKPKNVVQKLERSGLSSYKFNQLSNSKKKILFLSFFHLVINYLQLDEGDSAYILATLVFLILCSIGLVGLIPLVYFQIYVKEKRNSNKGKIHFKLHYFLVFPNSFFLFSRKQWSPQQCNRI